MAELTKDEMREYLRWAVALQNSMETSIRAEDPTNAWKYGGYKTFARKYTQIVREIAMKMALPPILDTYNLDTMPSSGDTVAFQQKEIFEGVHTNVALLRAYLENKIGIVEDETAALRDFSQARLRSAIFHIPDKERAIQDAIEQLLIGRGLQKGQKYDREIGRVKISSKKACLILLYINFHSPSR
jgi:hypothetical protein